MKVLEPAPTLERRQMDKERDVITEQLDRITEEVERLRSEKELLRRRIDDLTTAIRNCHDSIVPPATSP